MVQEPEGQFVRQFSQIEVYVKEQNGSSGREDFSKNGSREGGILVIENISEVHEPPEGSYISGPLDLEQGSTNASPEKRRNLRHQQTLVFPGPERRKSRVQKSSSL